MRKPLTQEQKAKKAAQRKLREQDPEVRARRNAVARAWAEANAEKRREYARAHDARRPGWKREWHLSTTFGITEQGFKEMLANQGGGCAICATALPGGRYGQFHVDHDHVTGRVRGILCTRCNTGIGALRDDPALVRRAAMYLEAAQ